MPPAHAIARQENAIRRQFRNVRCPQCQARFADGVAACPNGSANCEFPTCAICHGRGLRISFLGIAFAVTLGGIGLWMLRVYLTQAEAGNLGGQDRSLISAFALCLGGIGFTARQLLWPWCDHCKGSGRASKHGNVALYFFKGASTAGITTPPVADQPQPPSNETAS